MSADCDKTQKPSPGAMAFLVGEALKAGGIKVIQTKEKFGSIRVYVTIPNNHEARTHYREIYLSAMEACPELADNLRGSADRSEWLYATEADLDAAIARHVARGGANALDAWSPHFTLARQLIKGEDTSDFLDGDTEIVDAGEVEPPVTLSRDLFEAAHAAVGWACVQGGGGQWLDIHKQMSDALNNTKKR
jgi:hypothetical protein